MTCFEAGSTDKMLLRQVEAQRLPPGRRLAIVELPAALATVFAERRVDLGEAPTANSRHSACEAGPFSTMHTAGCAIEQTDWPFFVANSKVQAPRRKLEF